MKQFISLYFSAVLIIISTHAKADTIYFDVSTIEKAQHLAKQAYILEDSKHRYSLEDIFKKPDSSFDQANSNIPYLDFTTSTYWLKIRLSNKSDHEQFFFVETARPLTDVVNFFVLDSNGKMLKSYFSGDRKKYSERPIDHKDFIFPTTFPANSERTIIVETRSDGEILKLPIKFWQKEAFVTNAVQEEFYLGMYYGLFALVILLFSFFGFALKQKLYLYFVSYVLFLALFQLALGGLAYKILWPFSIWFGNHAILVLAAISMILMLFYVKNFLDFRKSHPNYLKVYNGFIGLLVVGLLMAISPQPIYQYAFPLLNGLSLITVFYILYGIWLKFRTDDKPDISLALAYLSLCLGAIFFILGNVHIIESEFLATNGLKVGSAFELIFLSIAMAGRYRKTQQDKITAQDKAYKSLKQLNRLKKNQTKRLEKEVAHRTEELQQKSEALATKNNEIINSINYAKRLQNAILPAKSTLDKILPEHGIVYLPKDIVSGDFYWVDETEDHVFFAVADCTGHGVPGAMVSMVGFNGLNRCVNELNLSDPAAILNQLTDIVEATFSKNDDKMSDGMDIALCVWDRKNKIEFAGAFNPLYHLRNGEMTVFKGDKQPIGKYIRRTAFTKHEILLEKGDAVYLFSDGYADQFGGPKNKKLKYGRFKKIIIEANGLNSQQITSRLKKQFDDWKGDQEQIDDVCVMTVRF